MKESLIRLVVLLMSAATFLLLASFLIAGALFAPGAFAWGATAVLYMVIGFLLITIPGGLLVSMVIVRQSLRRRALMLNLEVQHRAAIIQQERAKAIQEIERAAPAIVQAGPLTQISERARASESDNQAEPERARPAVEALLSLIPYNELKTAMGIEAATGQPLIMDIRKSVHFKLIGGSGQGKSCVAAAMLDIAVRTNDPDHLRIGLLDLEHNTSRLFENLPHVAEIGPKRQRLIGRDADEVAQRLKLLQWELKRRSDLGEEHCRLREPVLLVYVEEMLALKYEVVDEKLKKEMLAAVNILGVRARKYGIFLLAVMQVDYSDKSTREAMAQFRTRAGFAIDPEAARASGFLNTKLVKENYLAGRAGQFVLERPSYSGIALAPDYDVAAKLAALSGSGSGVGREVDTEEVPEVAPMPPLPPARHAATQHEMNEQERRILQKFLSGLSVSQIVASEFSNGRGEPLSGGDAFKKRSQEVQDLLRRILHQVPDMV